MQVALLIPSRAFAYANARYRILTQELIAASNRSTWEVSNNSCLQASPKDGATSMRAMPHRNVRPSVGATRTGARKSNFTSIHKWRRVIAPACIGLKASRGQKIFQHQLVEKNRGVSFGIWPSLLRHSTSRLFSKSRRPFKSSTSLSEKQASSTTKPSPGPKMRTLSYQIVSLAKWTTNHLQSDSGESPGQSCPSPLSAQIRAGMWTSTR